MHSLARLLASGGLYLQIKILIGNDSVNRLLEPDYVGFFIVYERIAEVLLNVFCPVLRGIGSFDFEGFSVAVVTKNAVLGPDLHKAIILDVETLSAAYLL